MDPLTITLAFTLKQGTTSVPAAVTYSGMTARLTPNNVLSAGLVLYSFNFKPEQKT